MSLPRIELATWWTTRRSLFNPFATEPTDDGVDALPLDSKDLCFRMRVKFDFSQNFKMIDRCWFLHGPFGSLIFLFVLLGIGSDLFGIFPYVFITFFP